MRYVSSIASLQKMQKDNSDWNSARLLFHFFLGGLGKHRLAPQPRLWDPPRTWCRMNAFWRVQLLWKTFWYLGGIEIYSKIHFLEGQPLFGTTRWFGHAPQPSPWLLHDESAKISKYCSHLDSWYPFFPLKVFFGILRCCIWRLSKKTSCSLKKLCARGGNWRSKPLNRAINHPKWGFRKVNLASCRWN